MNYIKERLNEASSLAGLGLLAQSVGLLLVNPADMTGWAGVLAGVGAILRKEGCPNA